MNRFIAPLLGFLMLIGFLGFGLTLNPRQLPSPLVDKLAPPFSQPQLLAPQQNFTNSQLHGQVWLLNVWASWCAACRTEHALLMRLAQTDSVAPRIPIVGLNYKDNAADAIAWLQRFGNPYRYIPIDAHGEVGIDYGVYGVPETYLIDKNGRIRVKQTGPLTEKILHHSLLPWIQKLREEV